MLLFVRERDHVNVWSWVQAKLDSNIDLLKQSVVSGGQSSEETNAAGVSEMTQSQLAAEAAALDRARLPLAARARAARHRGVAVEARGQGPAGRRPAPRGRRAHAETADGSRQGRRPAPPGLGRRAEDRPRRSDPHRVGRSRLYGDAQARPFGSHHRCAGAADVSAPVPDQRRYQQHHRAVGRVSR